MTTFRRYDVEVLIDGKPRYMMDLSSKSPEAAARRARVQTMALHPQTDFGRITTGEVTLIQEGI